MPPGYLAETTLMDVRSGDEQDPQGVPAIPTESSEDFQCSCYKCRKSSPSTRGRAVPRSSPSGAVLPLCPLVNFSCL